MDFDDIIPDFEERARRARPYIARLRFAEETERDACEKVVAFQGISKAVVLEEWKRLGKAQNLKHRVLDRIGKKAGLY